MVTTMDIETGSGLDIGGDELREMFRAAIKFLEKNEETINRLNVFPVPDGDTGTNMLLTMHSVMAETEKVNDSRVSVIAGAMARGALLGARGNSGVILSQIMKGFASGLADREILDSNGMAGALLEASRAARAALSQPREGTMLTVIKDAAAAARDNVTGYENDLVTLMEVIVEEARLSVERTPELLQVLRDAGVVDAGGYGVYIILKGILSYLKGEETGSDSEPVPDTLVRQLFPAVVTSARNSEEAYGYCTEMIIRGNELRQEQVRRWVEGQGKSAVVVGDENTIKIHVHTFHPGTVIEFALSLGTVHDLKIQNMDDQHEDFIRMPVTTTGRDGISVVAVAAGEGLQEVFRSLGVSSVIPGGQTMNPSCADILQAVSALPSDKVIILPNNKNVIPAAQQAAGLSEKEVRVLPTRSVPQGLNAMVSFSPGEGLDENVAEMEGFRENVRTVEITSAVRDARVKGVRIAKGSCIGIIDGDIECAGENTVDVVIESLRRADAENAGIITFFYGEGIETETAGELRKAVMKVFPGTEVEVIRGSQPHYSYIISVER